jgi:arylsulfatase A-like enzyme
MTRPSFKQIFGLQLLLMGLLYLASVVTFVSVADSISVRFTALTRGPYLSTAILAQLRVIPAYALLALLATILTRFFLRQSARRWIVFQIAVADLILFGIALGPALLAGPGLFDSVARKLPSLDLYALQRVHVLHALAMLFGILCVVAFFHLVQRPRARAVTVVMSLAVVILAFRKSIPTHATPLVQQNVLIIATDSWRFDRLGVHGATHAGLTPNLDAFARTAVDFRNHHVSTASTLESWVTFFTGLFPPRHGIRSMYPSREEVAAIDARHEVVPRLLAERGYDTFVSSDWVGNCFDLVDLGFAKRFVGPVQNFEALLLEATVRAHPLVPLFFSALPGVLGDALVPGRDSLASAARPAVLTERLFDDIDASIQAHRPFFGLLFLSPTHLPYNARPPFKTMYVDPAYHGPHRYQVEVGAHQLITTGFSPTLPPATIQHVRDLYDGAVSDFDDTAGQVLAQLEARGLTKNTIVIITTDHGEDLYDPGSTLGHGTNFFGGEQSTHIPFLVRIPGNKPGQVDALTRTADVAPTLLSLLGVRIPARLDGVSLLPLLSGEAKDLGLIAFAETCYLFFPKAKAMTALTDAEKAEVVELSGAADTLEVDPTFRHNLVLRPALRDAVIAAKDHMVRTARWKLIEIPGKTRSIRRLYDLQADPHQRTDLAGRGLPQELELSALLAKYKTTR